MLIWTISKLCPLCFCTTSRRVDHDIYWNMAMLWIILMKEGYSLFCYFRDKDLLYCLITFFLIIKIIRIWKLKTMASLKSFRKKRISFGFWFWGNYEICHFLKIIADIRKIKQKNVDENSSKNENEKQNSP